MTDHANAAAMAPPIHPSMPLASRPLAGPLLVACLAVFALAACGRGDDAAPPAATPPATAAAPAAAPAPAAAAPVADASAAATHEFAFTAHGADPGRDARILRWEDGPCGSTPVARVARMPLHDPMLLADAVVEFDAAGRQVRVWGKPYEADVLGVDGDRLLFRTDGAHAYWTDLDGAIGVLDPAPAGALDAPMIDCPALPAFAKSDYEQCYAATDAAGRPRKLAWEGACS